MKLKMKKNEVENEKNEVGNEKKRSLMAKGDEQKWKKWKNDNENENENENGNEKNEKIIIFDGLRL